MTKNTSSLTEGFASQISEIKKLENKADILDKKSKELRTQVTTMKDVLLADMDVAETDISRNRTHTATIAEQDVATIEDFDKAWNYIRRQNKPYLLYRRVNNAPWREEVKARRGRAIPGIKAFKKRTLSIKKTRTS